MRSRGTRDINNSDDDTRIFSKKEVCKPNNSRLKLIVAIIFGIILFAGGICGGFYAALRNSPVPSAMVAEDYLGRVNFLIIGVDGGVNGNGAGSLSNATRSDVLMVVSVDPDTKDVGILSIPRDTRVFISERGAFEKIAHAHAHGGASLAVETVESFLKIQIHHYVRLDFEGFRKVINTLGGVDLDVPRKMDYEDPEQDLYIHLLPGPQTLDGDKALQYVRYREYVFGDIDRIKAQEQFLRALIDKAFRFSTVWKIPELIKDVMTYVNTDLTYQDALWYVEMAMGIEPENVRIDMVPGIFADVTEINGNEVSYWVANSVETSHVVDEMIRGIDPVKNANIKVTIENGSGVSGAGDYMASILRHQGFWVVDVKDVFQGEHEETRVLGMESNKEARVLVTRSVKAMCRDAKAYVDDGVTTDTDVVIIIGEDFEKLPSTDL